jgi:hypothetical protein
MESELLCGEESLQTLARELAMESAKEPKMGEPEDAKNRLQ